MSVPPHQNHPKTQQRSHTALHTKQTHPQTSLLSRACMSQTYRGQEMSPLCLSISMFPHERRSKNRPMCHETTVHQHWGFLSSQGCGSQFPPGCAGVAQGQEGCQDSGPKSPSKTQPSIAVQFSAAPPICTSFGCGFLISEIPWKLWAASSKSLSQPLLHQIGCNFQSEPAD